MKSMTEQKQALRLAQLAGPRTRDQRPRAAGPRPAAPSGSLPASGGAKVGGVVLDAIVLLGCRIGPGGRPTTAARRRVDRAAQAWRQGGAPLVVVSGGRRWHGVYEADALRDLLVEAGVPPPCIIAERRSRCTRQNARFSAELLAGRGAARVGVVTCDWHLPRALSAFRRLGLEVTGLGAPSPPVGRWRHAVRGGRERMGSVVDRLALATRCRP